MNTMTHHTELHSMLEAAMLEDREDGFIRELFSVACMVMLFKMSPETNEYVEKCIQETHQHLEAGWGKDWKPKDETA